eukprot:3981838-Alexandrium_andersonii.AAC.1
MDRWVQVYGRPKAIRTDPDAALLSRASVDFFGEFGIQLMPCAADAHWQIGAIERVIQTLKQ